MYSIQTTFRPFFSTFVLFAEQCSVETSICRRIEYLVPAVKCKNEDCLWPTSQFTCCTYVLRFSIDRCSTPYIAVFVLLCCYEKGMAAIILQCNICFTIACRCWTTTRSTAAIRCFATPVLLQRAARWSRSRWSDKLSKTIFHLHKCKYSFVQSKRSLVFVGLVGLEKHNLWTLQL